MTEFQPILLDLPLPIMTPRLKIRQTMPGDGTATHEAIKETFEQLQQWMPWTSKELEPPDITEVNIREVYLAKRFQDERHRAKEPAPCSFHRDSCA